MAHHVGSLRHEMAVAIGLGADIGQTLKLDASVVRHGHPFLLCCTTPPNRNMLV